MKKFLAVLLALTMGLSLVACGGKSDAPADGGNSSTEAPSDYVSDLKMGYDLTSGEEFYGPYYDEWSDMTDEELYELAQKEGGEISVYATSSKMLKEEEPFEAAFPGLDLVVYDMKTDEVLQKAKIENDTGNITADVL